MTYFGVSILILHLRGTAASPKARDDGGGPRATAARKRERERRAIFGAARAPDDDALLAEEAVLLGHLRLELAVGREVALAVPVLDAVDLRPAERVLELLVELRHLPRRHAMLGDVLLPLCAGGRRGRPRVSPRSLARASAARPRPVPAHSDAARAPVSSVSADMLPVGKAHLSLSTIETSAG